MYIVPLVMTAVCPIVGGVIVAVILKLFHL
jgi:hypothetical protein